MKKISWMLVLAVIGLSGCSMPFGEGEKLPSVLPAAEADGGVTGNASANSGQGAPRLVSADRISSVIEIGPYENLIPESMEVTDEMVGERIRSELVKDSTYLRNGSDTIEEGDTVVINYVGTVNYNTFDGSVANNYSLLVGSGEMAEGFEDALVGMTPGQTKAFTVTYPEDAPEAELQGAQVDYRVTVQSASRPAAFDDEWAQEKGFDSAQAYREEIRKELEEEARSDDARREQLWQQIVKSSRVLEYPPEDLEAAKENYYNLVRSYAQQAQMDLEAFALSQGMTMEQLEEQAQTYARAKVKQNLIVQGIMDQEGMSLGDEESLRIYEALAKEQGLEDPEQLRKRFGEQEINETVGLNRVLDFVMQGRG